MDKHMVNRPRRAHAQKKLIPVLSLLAELNTNKCFYFRHKMSPKKAFTLKFPCFSLHLDTRDWKPFSRNIFWHFQQCSDIFGKSSEIFGSGCYIFGNRGRDETKISHIWLKKVGRYMSGNAQFPFWISIDLAKICCSRIVINHTKTLPFL